MYNVKINAAPLSQIYISLEQEFCSTKISGPINKLVEGREFTAKSPGWGPVPHLILLSPPFFTVTPTSSWNVTQKIPETSYCTQEM